MPGKEKRTEKPSGKFWGFSQVICSSAVKRAFIKAREIAKLFFAILIGAISYFIFSDAVNDSLDYSVYTLAGYPLYILLAAAMLPLLGRITAFKGKNTAFMYTMVYAALTFFRFWPLFLLTGNSGHRFFV